MDYLILALILIAIAGLVTLAIRSRRDDATGASGRPPERNDTRER